MEGRGTRRRHGGRACLSAEGRKVGRTLTHGRLGKQRKEGGGKGREGRGGAPPLRPFNGRGGVGREGRGMQVNEENGREDVEGREGKGRVERGTKLSRSSPPPTPPPRTS